MITTGDGSKTIHMPEWNEQYHSKHGALQEALHVFIEMGLKDTLSRKHDISTPISILEYGLGTGLNAMITAQYPTNFKINYTAVEAYPVSLEEAMEVNYGNLLNDNTLYQKLHGCEWNQIIELTESFTIKKVEKKFDQIHNESCFDIIYFDAFGPRVQPDLWTEEIFKAAFKALKPNGVLTTYCAQGQARRNMQSAGFLIERLPGPPGKREMLRGRKEF
ncbi:tRNA (5-methylaminomethyl-2-thiouridine)(34)-methyltransferase MnmD [Nonlabens mediterrranea]|uniref:tRNA (5-methylaminomethyl-2-thiouridine)(34)-methyltransferase MnmD n=1 Tax=Nonlabens mediterrranea TaxID=1419947 RepID=A0ABS0A4H7_9FLAO|nr:tRNA (5-methylaminomethyl-2-thiouridine)(34)-methyltransferase MnmD [Nonlabens mediterrranea]